MTVIDNNPGGSGGNDQGPGATVVGSRLSDVARSVHDPANDLKLPVLHLDDWNTLGDDQRWTAAVIAAQGFYEAEDVISHNGRRAAKQWGPDDQTLAGLRAAFASIPPKDLLARTRELGSDIESLPGGDGSSGALGVSARLFLALRDRFLEGGPELSRTRDLRAPWFEVRDQKSAAGCVGWALADLLWRQGQERLDVPSARFIWQAAKEMDAEERPTTMIAGAGTSLRAALRLVEKYGHALESEISSESDAPYRGSIDAFYKATEARKIHAFVNMGNDAKTRIAWLSLGRPLVCSLRAGQNFVNAAGPGVVVEGDDVNSPDLFGHCVTVMGYRVGACDAAGRFVTDQRSLVDLVRSVEDRDRRDVGNARPARRNEDFPVQYLVRNTSGADWGDRGYAWMSHEDFRRQVRESYGVFLRRSDLIKLIGSAGGRGEKTSAA